MRNLRNFFNEPYPFFFCPGSIYDSTKHMAMVIPPPSHCIFLVSKRPSFADKTIFFNNYRPLAKNLSTLELQLNSNYIYNSIASSAAPSLEALVYVSSLDKFSTIYDALSPLFFLDVEHFLLNQLFNSFGNIPVLKFTTFFILPATEKYTLYDFPVLNLNINFGKIALVSTVDLGFEIFKTH